MLLNRPTPQIYSLFWCHNTPHNSGRRSNLFLPSSPGCQPIIPLALQNVFRAVRQHAYVPMDIIQIIAFHPSVFGRNKSVGANIVGGCAIRLFRNHVLPVLKRKKETGYPFNQLSIYMDIPFSFIFYSI